MAVSPSSVGVTRRERDRERMRELIAAAGFPHALERLANVVAVEVAQGLQRDSEERMAQVAEQTTKAVLGAMVYVARLHGWRGAGA